MVYLTGKIEDENCDTLPVLISHLSPIETFLFILDKNPNGNFSQNFI